jgi:hypothetical protein
MPRHVPSVSDTVDQILREVDGGMMPKIASKKASGAASDPLKKLAQMLQDAPDPVLNYDVLHVVKTAMLYGELGPLPTPKLEPETGDSLSSGLRKLANALRVEDHADHERLLAKGAHTLRAGRGLMLLRELVRE